MKKMIIAVAIATSVAVGSFVGLSTFASGESADSFRESVLRDPDVPSMGNPQGDITIVEYFDYQCPYCKKVAPELVRIAKEDGKLRIVMKDWPIFGAASQYAAKMVLAAKYQNKYHEAHTALIGATTKLSEQIVQDLLSRAGVDIDQAVKDMTTYQPAIEALLARNNEQAEAFGFQGTPAFIVGTFRIPGVLDAAGFKQAIADARAAARKKK
ncbi:DsbA family protein [Bradyrhizobium diazoefficiens]|nr:DsbA family protein [Bradyrhizobium diazoefficiens]MBR0967269.1 DsbA family protein [Bradyrhizobium diazoefficiens]MBR0977315.1 DsbA family protein [Bradyrhizobium diazoefficiens]MBR1007970.1 DsbA family protein [Bradyrhizobium diazoefficiens]MBR1013380.1 DsbA family protein [Bradyrhizobium diazoefficiens]MBR1051637.1 DsbA family protein [Bradyrhizobium diazoefficiens]